MSEVEQLAAQAREGDREAFERIVERFRPELVVHCYRLSGRYDEAEDAAQDALLRAWRSVGSLRDGSGVRAWLYRIATNVCLDRVGRDQRRRELLARTTVRDGVAIPVAATVPWLQAIPDAALDAADSRSPSPEERVTARETIAIAYIAALQHLPQRQRAVFVLRDACGWSAREAADLLEMSVSAANSALNRARTTMRDVLGEDRESWSRPASPQVESEVVARYVRAIESGDDEAIAALLTQDCVVSHQPFAGQPTGEVSWYAGRNVIVEAWRPATHATPSMHLSLRPIRVNREVALATYARLPGSNEHRAFALDILRLRGDEVAEIVNLTPDQFPALGIPVLLERNLDPETRKDPPRTPR